MNYKVATSIAVISLFLIAALGLFQEDAGTSPISSLVPLGPIGAAEGYWNSNKNNMSSLFDSLIEESDLKSYDGPESGEILSGPQILELTRGVSGSGGTGFEKASRIFEYASKNITYRVHGKWRNASSVIESGNGDCTDKAIAMVSMLREAGIESYVIYSSKKLNGTKHAWVAARVDNNWLELDPTAKDIFYVHKCRESGCAYLTYYENIGGMFNSDVSLRCS